MSIRVTVLLFLRLLPRLPRAGEKTSSTPPQAPGEMSCTQASGVDYPIQSALVLMVQENRQLHTISISSVQVWQIGTTTGQAGCPDQVQPNRLTAADRATEYVHSISRGP